MRTDMTDNDGLHEYAYDPLYQIIEATSPKVQRPLEQFAYDSVGNWLANSPKEDPYAKVFLAKLSKIVYFDCWFDPTVVETVPALLKSNPAMKIVGTVHMEKPKKHAALLAGRYKMRKMKKKDELVGAGGRLLIFSATSHWKAMISLLREALDT